MGKELFFDSNNFPAAASTLTNYADRVNALAEHLTAFSIDTGPEAMRQYITGGVDAIVAAIHKQRDAEMADLPAVVRRTIHGTAGEVDLRTPHKLLGEMSDMTGTLGDRQRRAGRRFMVPMAFIGYNGETYTPDLEALRSHFTVYSSPEIDKVVKLAKEVAAAYNELKKATGQDKLIGDSADKLLTIDRVSGDMGFFPGGLRFV